LSDATPKQLLEWVADDSAFGIPAIQSNSHVLEAPIPVELVDRESDRILRVAGIIQLSFLKMDVTVSRDMPGYLRQKILDATRAYFPRRADSQ
jgi:hypothetical protein